MTPFQKQHTNLTIRLLFMIGCLVLSQAFAQSPAPRQLDWSELLPDQSRRTQTREIPPLPDFGSLGDDSLAWLNESTGQDAPSVVTKLDGAYIQITGYPLLIAPLAETPVKVFWLTAEFGAGIYLPMPPSNQIIRVQLSEPYALKKTDKPLTVTGYLSSSSYRKEALTAGYQLQASHISENSQ